MNPARKPGCLIIDANVFSLFGKTPINDKAAKLIAREVMGGNLRIASGGKNWRELAQMQDAGKWLSNRVRTGQAIRYDDSKVDSEEKRIISGGGLESDDPHVIALSNVSGAKLLFSHDKHLHEDFKKICRGSIYQDASHHNLLKNRPPCNAP